MEGKIINKNRKIYKIYCTVSNILKFRTAVGGMRDIEVCCISAHLIRSESFKYQGV
jgi:hypothetical protein